MSDIIRAKNEKSLGWGIFLSCFCQFTGSSCWKPNKVRDNFASQFDSRKLFPSCILVFSLWWLHCQLVYGHANMCP